MFVKKPFLIRFLSNTMFTAVLATLGICTGVVPELTSNSLSLNFKISAVAQNYSEEDLVKFARAVLEMESFRQQAYEDIRQIIGRTPPNIVCNQPASFKTLPQDARAIARKYCRDSENIVRNSGLSVSKFNEIATSVRSNPTLERRIQQLMIEIRRRQQR